MIGWITYKDLCIRCKLLGIGRSHIILWQTMNLSICKSGIHMNVIICPVHPQYFTHHTHMIQYIFSIVYVKMTILCFKNIIINFTCRIAHTILKCGVFRSLNQHIWVPKLLKSPIVCWSAKLYHRTHNV